MSDETQIDALLQHLIKKNYAPVTDAISNDPAIIHERDSLSSFTLLQRVCSLDCSKHDKDKLLQITEALIQAGAHVNDAKPKEDYPLVKACTQSDISIIKLLLARGADLNLGRVGPAACIRRSKDEQLETIKVLVEHGLDVNQSFAMFGNESNRRTVLDFARSEEVADYLIAHGAKRGADL